ncbi:hypothetical protein ACHAW5_009996 [Stephanodiscus triporus]|uniref:Major facilitator superfamily (MFS) profile domain-containing protein n=1 Tax=Stephanodiscus triporus TaxID=2934178 RepID=A0ABD3NSI8_9STRA
MTQEKAFEEFVVGDLETPPATDVDDGGDSTPLAAPEANADDNNKREFRRSLSISEQAQELHESRAPSFLRWIEVPLRIMNPATGVYLEEATGHAMDVCSRGPINQTGSFVGSAILLAAATQAGGPNMPVYGIKASSLLTVATMIVGIVAGVSLPIIGAFVDHTDHRKAFGSITALITVVAVGLQVMVGQNTWFACFLIKIIGGFSLIVHQVCALAYLPDLSHDVEAMAHYTAILTVNQYIVQGMFTIIIIVTGTKMTNLQTARLAAGLSCSVGVVLMGYAWTFLFRKRPKLRDVPPGSNLMTTGFKQLFRTSRVVFREYKALKWFMIALLFSPEAGSGVVLAIAVTFLTFFVQMTVQEIAIVSLVMLLCNIPGAFMSRKMCKVVNPLNSFRMAEVCFACTNALIAGLVTGSTQRDKNLLYLFGGLVGFSFGWMFPSQKTLSVALIPKGQEFEIMGLMSFFGQIVGWLPVFVFTAMNEAGLSMRWGVSTISWFLIASFLCTLGCGSYEEAVRSVEHTSEKYLNEFSLRSRGNKGESSPEGGPTTTAMTESGRDVPVE